MEFEDPHRNMECGETEKQRGWSLSKQSAQLNKIKRSVRQTSQEGIPGKIRYRQFHAAMQSSGGREREREGGGGGVELSVINCHGCTPSSMSIPFALLTNCHFF